MQIQFFIITSFIYTYIYISYVVDLQIGLYRYISLYMVFYGDNLIETEQ